MSLYTSMAGAPLIARTLLRQQGSSYVQNPQTCDISAWRKGLEAASAKSLCGQMAGSSRLEDYTKYLRSKYGSLTVKSVGKDKKSLEGFGKSMSGNDVIIAPNILEETACDPEKAAYYERKIDAFFEDIPRQRAMFAAKGLDYQPCGVVVHEDGSVTYISGCTDSTERVAKVNAVNKAKREKQAAERKAALEHSRNAARIQQDLMERYFFEKAFSVSLMSGLTPGGGHLQ